MITILTTDSMFAIQNKLKSNRNIQFQKGKKYKITKQLILDSNSVIDLNGATLLRCGNIQSVFITRVDKNTTQYNGVHDVIFKNGTIENIGSFYADNLVTLMHAKNITIDNVNFIDGAMHDVEINGSKNVTIKNCTFKGHYSKSTGDTYKENIQYDMCEPKAIFINGTKISDPIYDGTCCEDLSFENLTFDEGYRGKINCCIGQHCQLSGKYHKNIIVRNCSFKGGTNTSVAVKMIGVNDAIIENNKCEGYGRFVLIQNSTYSYNNQGGRISALDSDGLCSKITIRNNVIKPLKTFVSNIVYVKSVTNKKHSKIIRINNNVLK